MKTKTVVEVIGDQSPLVVATVEPDEVFNATGEIVVETLEDWPKSLQSPTSKKKKHRIASGFERS